MSQPASADAVTVPATVLEPVPEPVLVLGLGWFPEERTGLNRFLFDLVNAASATQDVRAVVVGPAPGAPPSFRPAGNRTDPLPVRLLRFARGSRASAGGAVVVDGHFALHTAAALMSRRVRSLPLVVHFQGPWADESRSSGSSGSLGVLAKHWVERIVYRRADALIVLSTGFKRTLVERYGVSPWRVRVIAPGVDLDHFRPGDRAAARQALGLPADAFVVAATRRLVRRTGIDVLLDAWSRTNDQGRGVLVVAGIGPEGDALRRRAERLELGDRVRFLGEVSEADLRRLYQSADLTVVPSRELEGYGLVVIESWACGTPVIGSDVDGLADAIEEIDPGLLVPPDDPRALAELLSATITDPSGLPDRERCREAAEAHGWPGVVAATSRVHNEAVRPSTTTRPRAVFLDHTAQISGAEVSLARLLPALTQVDTHVVLAADGPLVRRIARDGGSVEVLPLAERSRSVTRETVSIRQLPLRSGPATIAYVARLTARLRRLRPDVVHTNSLKSALYGGVAGRLAGIPVVWQVNDRIAEDYLPRHAVRLMRAAAGRLPHHIIVNSEATAATLPVDRPVTVIPHPIPVAPTHPDRPRSPGPLRVGIVGRLSPWKGQDVFLKAFALAFPDDDATAVIVGGAQFGEDEIEPGLRALADDLGITERVEILGHRDDVPALMASLDVLVHASTIPEPFGMVVGEGMALGVPVVAADAAGPSEIIHHGVDGLLYPMGDVTGLAAALRTLSADPDLRHRLGAAGRERAADFSPEVVAAAVAAVHADVLTNRRRAPRRGGIARRHR